MQCKKLFLQLTISFCILRLIKPDFIIVVFDVFLRNIYSGRSDFLHLSEQRHDPVPVRSSDAAWVFAPDHISDLFWKRELLFSDNLFVFYNIDGDIVIDKT